MESQSVWPLCAWTTTLASRHGSRSQAVTGDPAAVTDGGQAAGDMSKGRDDCLVVRDPALFWGKPVAGRTSARSEVTSYLVGKLSFNQ